MAEGEIAEKKEIKAEDATTITHLSKLARLLNRCENNTEEVEEELGASIFVKTVTKVGHGAHVMTDKEHLGKKAIVIIKK